MTADNARTEDATRAVHQALNCDRGEYDDHTGGGHACFEHETDLDSDGHCPVAKTIAQTLADAGLLANPHRPKGPVMKNPPRWVRRWVARTSPLVYVNHVQWDITRGRPVRLEADTHVTSITPGAYALIALDREDQS